MTAISRIAIAVALAVLCTACEQQRDPASPAPEIERAGEATGSSGVLLDTAWRLEDLGGATVIEGAEATLEFPEDGKAAGHGSCNRFFAPVTVSGDSIRFGPVGATRMACEAPVASQEAKYLKALEGAERFVIEGDSLSIHSRELPAPLIFTRTSR